MPMHRENWPDSGLGGADVAVPLACLQANMRAAASAGFAKNLRKDMYATCRNISFSNIDQVFHRRPCHAADHRRNQRAERLSDDHPHRGARAGDAGLLLGHGLSHQREAGSDLPGRHPRAGRRACTWSLPTLTRSLSGCFKTYDRLNSVVQENLRGIRVVKSYVREDHEKEKFGDVSREHLPGFLPRGKASWPSTAR